MSDNKQNEPWSTFLVSAAEESAELFRLELKDRRLGRILQQFTPRRYLLQVAGPEVGYFWQHKAPAHLIWPTPQSLEGGERQEFERAPWSELAELWKPFSGLTYSVQFESNVRLRFPIQDMLEIARNSLGLPVHLRDDRRSEAVITIFWLCCPSGPRLLFGFSRTAENLSPWNGGICRIPRSIDRISRAESKLLEAWEAFAIPTPTEKARALDLGAAPGGWSRILAGLGFEVDAVDPADLSGRLADDRRIRHHRTTAGEFLRSAGPEKYRLLVSDMKMSAPRAAELLGRFRGLLLPHGTVLATFKLPAGANGYHAALAGLEELSKRFQLVAARQLYFNRKELTVMAQQTVL